MRFKPGDAVHVAALGKAIVREVRSRGRYLVELKGRSVLVAESQLSPGESGKPGRPSPPSEAADLTNRNGASQAGASPSIDLHGMTVADAAAAVDAFLNEAMLASLDEVRIIHGRSGGRVKRAVHERLRRIVSVRGFRLDPRNEGVTIVTL
jgi:DNA mismatch repair protein MutS2